MIYLELSFNFLRVRINKSHGDTSEGSDGVQTLEVALKVTNNVWIDCVEHWRYYSEQISLKFVFCQVIVGACDIKS